jgi:hypothetical protein
MRLLIYCERLISVVHCLSIYRHGSTYMGTGKGQASVLFPGIIFKRSKYNKYKYKTLRVYKYMFFFPEYSQVISE